MGERIVWEFVTGMYTLLYLKWITNDVLMYSTGNTAQCYVVAWVGGVLGRRDICVCMAESLCCSPKTITTLLISYAPIENKKLKKKKMQPQNEKYMIEVCVE